jgi:hypothetical protein
MRPIAIWTVITLALLTAGCGGGTRTISAGGVRVHVPSNWHVVKPVQAVDDPRTLLVIGTAGAAAKSSRCEIASYRVPARGAVVVVVGWRTITSAGGTASPGRGPLKKLVSVTRPSFECFSGRGAVTSLTLAGKAYQVNVMVGNRASKQQVSDALAVARSFDLAR